jgi:hypothetical protein
MLKDSRLRLKDRMELKIHKQDAEALFDEMKPE